MVCRVRRWRDTAGIGVGLCAALCLAPAEATAQRGVGAFDLQLFQPSPSARSLLGADLAEVPTHLHLTASLWAGYAHGVLVDTHNAAAVPVRDAWTAEAQVALGLFQHLEVGLSLPLTRQTVPGVAPGGDALVVDDTTARTGFGDLRAFVKAPLLRGRHALALRAGVGFPTGASQRFVSAASWVFAPALVYSSAMGRWTVAADVGARLVRRNVVSELEVNDAVTFGAAAAFTVTPRVQAVLEGRLRAGVGASEGRATQNPMELLLGGRFTLGRGLTTVVAVGRGLTDAYGTPDLRGVIGLRWVSTRARPCTTGPEDHDGFEDGDFCGDPDNDGDGVPDARDRCPNDAEDRDGFEDDDGCPDSDNDGDGVPDRDDRCPLDPEDHDRYQNDDGCPEPDNDRDGVDDVRDSCPDEPEDRDGYQDDDGCPEPGPDAVVVTRTDSRLLVNQRIFFDFDSDTLRNVSFPVLDEVASAIRRNPDIARLRIEGHTDDVGTPDYNVDLSFRRARAVMEYLAAHGVARDRLEVAGFGHQRPVTEERTPEGQSLNRRVEFTIVRTTDAPAAESTTRRAVPGPRAPAARIPPR